MKDRAPLRGRAHACESGSIGHGGLGKDRAFRYGLSTEQRVLCSVFHVLRQALRPYRPGSMTR